MLEQLSKIETEKNVFLVHAIQVTDALDVSENNKSLNTKRLNITDKLDLLYGTNPTLSTSTLRTHTDDGMFTNGFGVVFSHGEIVSAHPTNAGTVALSKKSATSLEKRMRRKMWSVQ